MLTQNQVKLLSRICQSEHLDGRHPLSYGAVAWTECVCEPFGKSAGGIVSRALEADLIKVHGKGKESGIQITRIGWSSLLRHYDIPVTLNEETERRELFRAFRGVR